MVIKRTRVGEFHRENTKVRAFWVGEPRRLVLDQLARHYHRPFADLWDFVDYAQQQKLGLDLTTPPARQSPSRR